jgi:mRNA-degrading endonuclease RelE of RelBE toxin-antitoxin system
VTTFNKILRLPEFDKDIKKLLKKFRTLEEDLDIFLKTELVLYHKLKKDNKGIFLIPRLGVENPKIYKAKKFACRSLKGRGVQSGIRVIYGYFEKEDRIELIEIYFKGDKENEDEDRIARHYRELLKKGGETEKI